MLDRNGYTPLYRQFYQLLRKELVNFSIGANIPPERALCEKYGLDRVTVRKALALLAEEGFVERKQGRGTRVLRHDRPGSGRVLFLLCQGARMVDRLGEPFYARSLDALEECLSRTGRHLLYSKLMSGDDLAGLCESLEAQAVVLAGAPDAAVLEQCGALDIPLVCYNTYAEGFPSVMVDNDGGAAISARHLLALGHRRIGFIHVPGYINSERRLERFCMELHSAGLPDDALRVAEGDWSEDSGFRAAAELLSGEDMPVTALFGGNDSMAMGALRAARERGLRVPDDLSIVGFDGIAQSELTVPALTTSRVDVNAMAEAACMLLEHIMSRGMTRGINAVVSTELIVRNSTAAPGR